MYKRTFITKRITKKYVKQNKPYWSYKSSFSEILDNAIPKISIDYFKYIKQIYKRNCAR